MEISNSSPLNTSQSLDSISALNERKSLLKSLEGIWSYSLLDNFFKMSISSYTVGEHKIKRTDHRPEIRTRTKFHTHQTVES